MKSKLHLIALNQAWTLVPRPPNIRPITASWIHKINFGANGGLVRFKTRIVARGFQQQHEVNYQETFDPTVRWESIPIVTTLVAHHKWRVEHIDVATAFLNGQLREDVVME